ncbi:MAG: ATP-dependent RNA helicase RhlB [candidate division WS2 bacterium]|nr:ATP-dependent RNA helicase RhlB [Candidatus Psychracetigena formicireducens]
MDKTYQGLYHLIANEIEHDLSLAYYKIEEYKIVGEKDPFKIGRMEALGAILKTVLLKRLESSVEAFRNSIYKQINFFTTFKEYFNQGKILTKKQYDKYHLFFAEDNNQEAYNEILTKDLEEANLEHYNVNKFNSDIDKDIEILQEIHNLIEPINQEKDSKLLELKNKLVSLKDSEKTLLFTFYANTAEYLYQALMSDNSFQANYGKKIAKLTGSSTSKQREEVIERFQNGDIGLLISTDILSEGQNLQKAGIVINYDLHWNPVRMIQRAGRIDRIGSPFNTIYVYNFYPEKELESLLELVSILRGKIDNINATIGLDSSVLGEAINPRVFGIIKKLKGTQEDKKEAVSKLEEEQFGGGELFWQPLKEFGFDRLKEFCESLPHGIQSGLQKEWEKRDLKSLRGIFFYFQYADDYHLWYLYDILTGKLKTSKSEIIDYISCKESEPRVINLELDIFGIHNHIREKINNEFSELKVALSQSSTGVKEKIISDLLEELNYLKTEEIISTKELRFKTEYITNWLNKAHLTKKRMQQIRRIFTNYKNTSNWQVLINSLSEISQEIPVVEIPEEIISYDENKLKLICVQYIS